MKSLMAGAVGLSVMLGPPAAGGGFMVQLPATAPQADAKRATPEAEGDEPTPLARAPDHFALCSRQRRRRDDLLEAVQVRVPCHLDSVGSAGRGLAAKLSLFQRRGEPAAA